MSYVNNEAAYADYVSGRQAATEEVYWSDVYAQQGVFVPTSHHELPSTWMMFLLLWVLLSEHYVEVCEPESGRDCSFYPTWVCEGEDSRVVAQRAAA